MSKNDLKNRKEKTKEVVSSEIPPFPKEILIDISSLYKKTAKFFDLKYIDLSQNIEHIFDNYTFKINKKRYKYFIKNYLVSKSFKQVPNHKILSKVIN